MAKLWPDEQKSYKTAGEDMLVDPEQSNTVRLHDTEGMPDGMYRYQFNDFPSDASPEMPIDPEHFDPQLFPVAISVFPPNDAGDTLFAKVLRDVLEPAPGYEQNDIWIPFDMEERKKKFPKAFRELKMYMDAIKKDPEAHHVNL